jgi:hypothetical protein
MLNETMSEVAPAPQVEANSANNMSPSPAAIPAIARCADAWRRVYAAKLAKKVNKYEASQAAGEAYRQAMPPLVGYDNIRDFIACVGDAMLHHIIFEPESTKLLYAAQVALSSVRLQPKAKTPDAEG